MKNNHEIVGLLLNIAAVLILLFLIVVGLNLIGLYNLPAPIEKLLGTYKDTDIISSSDDTLVHELINDEKNVSTYYSASLNYENAEKLLKSLSVSRDYLQEVVITHYHESKVLVEKVFVKRIDGLCEAVISNANDVVVKSVKETENGISVENAENDSVILLPKGNFVFSGECGFIMDVGEFLASKSTLDEASFSQYSDENGSYITIVFDHIMGNIAYKQEYIISLDFGIVTGVKSYENNTLVYEMMTKSLTNAF